jgi:hypothetical protein
MFPPHFASANFWPCAHEDPVASQCWFHFIEAQRRKKTNSLSLSALIGKSHTQGEKRTVPAAHFIQVAAPQRWSHGCKHSVAVCWEHMQHERLMQRAENGGRQPWLLAISLRDVLLPEEWMDPWNKMDQGPHVPLRTQDLEVDLPVTTWCGRTNFPWECTVHDCKSLWLLAEHLSYVPVMRQGLGAVPSKYQGRVKAGLSIVGLESPFQVHLAPLQVLFSGTVGEILLAYGYLQNPQELADPQLWAWCSCHLEMKSPTKAQNPSGSFWLPAFTMLREPERFAAMAHAVSASKRACECHHWTDPRCSGLVLTGNSLQQFLIWFCNPLYAFVIICMHLTHKYKAWKLICSSWQLRTSLPAAFAAGSSGCRSFHLRCRLWGGLGHEAPLRTFPACKIMQTNGNILCQDIMAIFPLWAVRFHRFHFSK